MIRSWLICMFLLPVYPVLSQDSSAYSSGPPERQWVIELREEVRVRKTGLCGEHLKDPVRVVVTDEQGLPVAGVEVVFNIVSVPGNAEGSKVSDPQSVTDSSGIAEALLTLGSVPGTYHVACRIREGFPDNVVMFKATAQSRNWVYMLVIGLLGGLGLFLFGMLTMSEGMQRSAGERLRFILGTVTRNRFVGVGIGTLVTTIIQSSSAMSVMLVSFVNAGLIRFRQTIPVLLGAAIGTTITAQIIAFKITEYSLLLVAAGFFMQAFAKREQVKSAGTSIFGFGVLFFGMHIMSGAMAPLREWTPFIDLLVRLEDPLLGILAGTLFTALIQSSGAFVGIMIVLASQGLLSLEASIPLLLGSNLGTTVTALLSSMKSNREAKKVAVAFFIIKLISVLIFAGWTNRLGGIIQSISPEAPTPRLIANSHTFINLVLMIVVLPFSNTVAALTDRLMGKERERVPAALSTMYLDENLVSTPSLALNLAKQEIIRTGRIVQNMFTLITDPFLKKDPVPLNQIYTLEQEVNFLVDAIKSYLVKVNARMVISERFKESYQMLYTLNEFEKIADIISVNLANRAEKWIAMGLVFSEAGKTELAGYHAKVEKQIKRALEVFEETNLQKAALMKAKHKAYRSMSYELEKQHYTRIMEGMKESIESSAMHLEVLALFGSIDSNATNIARIALDREQRSA
jgi:phosphate:Na+ symporter